MQDGSRQGAFFIWLGVGGFEPNSAGESAEAHPGTLGLAGNDMDRGNG